jgi:hypothetical protein
MPRLKRVSSHMSPTRAEDLRILVSALVGKLGGRARITEEEILFYANEPTMAWSNIAGGILLEVPTQDDDA